ncbi:phosphoribosyltransferase family protein [Aquirhabdus parva]|uniref:Ribose-phosphate pyrophosphokinase n=1 Tax=Aquirhabdus parva TaxID=2283318 RepID=A0A345PA42_9GAMM|nr:phosphoribosyltransferase family protein [Aquirhabdus parva]AXI04151.1 ribose-phosphate pyrophosphokinase [Aquirhabdus parva]
MSIQVIAKNGTIVPIKFLQFSGGERHVQIAEAEFNSLNGNVTVRARMQSSNDVMDYVLLENVLLDAGCTIDLEIPYFPYARQDRVCATGQAFSLNIMTRLLNINASGETAGLQRSIKVWDCHSQVTTRLLRENTHFAHVTNISPAEIIQQSNTLLSILQEEKTVLICPDQGAKQRTKLIADSLNLTDAASRIIYCEKKRDPATGKILNAKVNATDLTGYTAVITDDICDGGATFIGIAQELRKLNCKTIILYVTHGIFSRGLGVFSGLIDQIFTTDSFPQEPSDLLNVINFSAPFSLDQGDQS